MTFTAEARELLKRLEGCRLTAYPDEGGVWTVGYGHTGSEVREGVVWTQEQAETALEHDLTRFIAAVRRLLGRVELTDSQFSALVIFSFNVGVIALAGSTALRDIHASRLKFVPAALALWNKIHDRSGVPVVSPGLVTRRNAEIQLWNSGSAAEDVS